MYTTKAERLVEAIEEADERHRSVPVLSLKRRRGTRHQEEVARTAGISQSYLSELESGAKPLRLATARKLAPALGTTADELLLSEALAKLSRAAQEGRIDLQLLLAEARRLAEILPSGEVGDAIADALVGIVREGPKALK